MPQLPKTCQMLLLLLLLLLAAHPLAAQQPGGKKKQNKPYRSPLFDSWKKQGKLEQLKKVEKNGYSLTLWAQTGNYDARTFLAGEKVDRDKFIADTLALWDWVLVNSAKHLKGPQTSYELVFARKFTSGTSAALRGTTAIVMEVHKWHERMYSRKSRKAVLYISAAHEEYHVQNYATDPHEPKFVRELTAMIWEATVVIRRGDGKIAYLWGGMNANKRSVKARKIDASADFTRRYDATLCRGLAYWIANQAFAQSRLEGLEGFARALLVDKRTGIAGVDGVAADRGLASKGKPVTVENAIAQYRAYLAR